MKEGNYHKDLQTIMDTYAHKVYDYAQKFPKEEIFGLTSQLKRAALSVVLNYTEDYARQRRNVFRNFLEISYGSLKESEYLIKFAHKRFHTEEKLYNELQEIGDKIGRMVWGIISKIK